MISVTTKMLAKNVLWLVASNACSEYCKSTRFLPEVTVANSTHIHINWENSFQGCDNVDSKSATLVIRRLRRDYFYNYYPESIPVNFENKEVNVEADPCLQHTDIKLELKYGRYYPQSSVSSYEQFYNCLDAISCTNLAPQFLYSGLLQEQVLDKICKKDNGQFLIPDVPVEIERCFKKTHVDEESKVLSFDIIHPCYKDTPAVVKGDLRDVKCPLEENFDEEKEDVSQNKDPLLSYTTMGFIIGVLILVVITGIVIVCMIRIQKNKRQGSREADINPVYDGAADYEYDDTSIDVTVGKKEVKAEVVDRSSIYGESEEGGWENAVVVDNNPYYES